MSFICLFCKTTMRTLDGNNVIANCVKCNVIRRGPRYIYEVYYKEQSFELIWNMASIQFEILDDLGRLVMRADFDIAVTPQNAYKKLPMLILFS